MDQAFFRFDYKLTVDTRLYVELPFATVLYVANDHSPNAQLQSASIGYNNAYLSGLQPAYQAIVRISGHQRVTPLGGMTANVQLGS